MSRRWTTALLLAAPVLLAVATAFVWLSTGGGGGRAGGGGVDALETMVTASDSAVVATVVGAEPASATVTLRVDEVLAGVDPGPQVTLVARPDSALPPAASGDVGIWFLAAPAGATGQRWSLVDDRGRYLVDPADEDRFADVPIGDPLVDRLEATEPIILRHQVQEAAAH